MVFSCFKFCASSQQTVVANFVAKKTGSDVWSPRWPLWTNEPSSPYKLRRHWQAVAVRWPFYRLQDTDYRTERFSLLVSNLIFYKTRATLSANQTIVIVSNIFPRLASASSVWSFHWSNGLGASSVIGQNDLWDDRELRELFHCHVITK